MAEPEKPKRGRGRPKTPPGQKAKPRDPAYGMMGQLTEELFAAAYVSCGCKSAAKAGALVNISKGHAETLIKRQSVKRHIEANVAWCVENHKVNGARVLSEAWNLLRSDISEVITRVNGRLFLRDDKDVLTHTNKAIKAITSKIEERVESIRGRKGDDDTESTIIKTEVKIEMHEKGQAMNLLAKCLGMFDKAGSDANKTSYEEALYKAWQEEIAE